MVARALKNIRSGCIILLIVWIDIRVVKEVSLGLGDVHTWVFVFIIVHVVLVGTLSRPLSNSVGCPVVSNSGPFNIDGRRCGAKILVRC